MSANCSIVFKPWNAKRRKVESAVRYWVTESNGCYSLMPMTNILHLDNVNVRNSLRDEVDSRLRAGLVFGAGEEKRLRFNCRVIRLFCSC